MPVRVFDDVEMRLLKEVLDSGNLSSMGGQMTARFEAAFAEAVGTKHGVAMNSAMSVLHACLMAVGVEAADEVICDPVCVFGAVAVMYANAVPVFVDVNPVTWNMDPGLIEAKITERTKALIVTHVCGLPAEMDRITDICKRHKVAVIEDCAHSLFATYKRRPAGSWGDIGSFSFQMSKQLALGDGGMAVTNDEELAHRLGLHAGAPTFHSTAYGLHYNYRMNEQTAAIGLGQLEKARGYIQELREIGAAYDHAVAPFAWLRAQNGPPEAAHTYHLWGCRFEGDTHGISLDDFKRVLEEEKCAVSIGYTGMPAYKHPLIAERLGYGKGCPLDCPLYLGRNNRYPEGLCPRAEDLFKHLMLVYTFGLKEEQLANAERLHGVAERLS
jgi:dTDP-4-amino-4,6-dideoxygalactose transaminase